MRSFFLEETLYGIIAISGSIMGQLIVFMSMFYSPIYATLWKPHAIIVVLLSTGEVPKGHIGQKVHGNKIDDPNENGSSLM